MANQINEAEAEAILAAWDDDPAAEEIRPVRSAVPPLPTLHSVPPLASRIPKGHVPPETAVQATMGWLADQVAAARQLVTECGTCGVDHEAKARAFETVMHTLAREARS